MNGYRHREGFRLKRGRSRRREKHPVGFACSCCSLNSIELFLGKMGALSVNGWTLEGGFEDKESGRIMVCSSMKRGNREEIFDAVIVLTT